MKAVYSIIAIFTIVVLTGVEAYKAPPVIGVIDFVRNGRISGWACQKIVPVSIDVHVYAINAAGRPGGSFVAAAKASRHSEQAVARSCGANFSAYRFYIQLSPQQRSRFRNQKVFVHGIKFFGNTPNSLLHNSGRFRIDPSQPAPGGVIPGGCNGSRGRLTACP